MNIKVLSGLHLEFHADGGEALLAELELHFNLKLGAGPG